MDENSNIRENKKFTNLLLYRQYNTYQVLLEAYPREGLSVEKCFSKVILYIMNWFKNRLGDEAIESIDEIQFLKTAYPLVDSYENFDITKVSDINKLSVIDVKTAYSDKDKSWVFELVEPDNGNEQKDIRGRTFITQILVYEKEHTVVFGVKTTCKEPAYNTEDADVYRPGFIKAIYSDSDIELSEEGIPYAYHFKGTPIIINGKAAQECSAINTGLIANPKRQLPIVFIPGSLYEKDEETKQMINGMTRSYLGFAHVIVVTKSIQKLFRNEMNNIELLDVYSEGITILYRSNPGRGLVVDPVYFETEEEEDAFDRLDALIKKTEPLRRNYDFGEYSFEAAIWDPQKIKSSLNEENDNTEQIKMVLAENDRLKADIEEKKRDNEELKRRVDEYELSKKRIEKQYLDAEASAARMERIANELQDALRDEKEQIKRYESRCLTYEKVISGANELAREKYRPLVHFPRFEMSAKEEILAWIEEHYSNVLIIHPNAKRAFIKDNRNLDWRCLCMMMHYLAGYTMHRQEGGSAISSDAARDYDPDGYGFICEPVSSGSGGSKKIYEDKYTIDISSYNENKSDVIMDMHLAQGKGRGDDMIRIYFYYDPEIKRSIVGYMPGHLPTRTDPH